MVFLDRDLDGYVVVLFKKVFLCVSYSARSGKVRASLQVRSTALLELD